MDQESVRTVVRTMLILLTRIAQRTRTQADDLMASILQTNENRLVDAVMALLAKGPLPPSDEQVAEALASVGIRV